MPPLNFIFNRLYGFPPFIPPTLPTQACSLSHPAYYSLNVNSAPTQHRGTFKTEWRLAVKWYLTAYLIFFSLLSFLWILLFFYPAQTPQA